METRPVLLIDLSAIFRACWHANPDGATSVAFQGTLDGVARCMGMVPNALVGVCCDARGNWRKALSPEYKAHREKQPEAMYGLLDRVKDRLRKDGHLLWAVDGFEADDLIAGATVHALEAGHDVVIASHDKDVTQLVCDRVRMLKTSTWEIIGPAEVTKKFGIEPEGIADYLALTGDKSDGIVGVPSVGPVTAAALLIKHGGLDGVYRAVDALQVFQGAGGVPYVETKTPAAAAIATPAIVDKLWRHKADAMLARKLVTLRTDAPIRFEDIYERREPQSLQEDNVPNVDDVIDPPPAKLASVPAATQAEPARAAAPDVPTESTALTVASGVTYERALEPMSSTAALSLGRVLYDSRAFSRFPSPGAITAVVMRGRELGIPAIASLEAFHYLADMNRIAPTWQTIVTLAEKAPQCEYIFWVEGDGKSATWETKHKKNPRPQRLTYTIEQATAAGLLDVKPGNKPGNWHKRPDEMLRKTAAVQLARLAYPGATLGMYADFELSPDTEESNEAVAA